MNFPRFLTAVAFHSMVVVAPMSAASALAQDAQAPTVQTPTARGAARGPGSAGGAGMHGGHHRGGRGHGGMRGMHHGGMPGDAAMTPDQRFEHRVQGLIGRLGLDEAQAAQVRRIMTEGRAQHEALRGERLTGEQARARHRQLMEADGQRIRAILRPDQQRVFDFYAERMREGADRMQRGGAGHGPFAEHARGRIREVIESLGLDETQRAQVRQIFEEGRAQHQALRAQALTGEERQARHRAIMEANAARIRVLLRPDQQQRFDQHLTQLRQRLEAFRQGAPATPPSAAPAPSGI
jgi:hypothetical protein